MTHTHNHLHQKSERRVGLAALLTGIFMLVEVVGGVISGSLALLADAGHMVVDSASLALAWLGFRLARQPADHRRSYGFDRLSVLVAFVNGLTLFVIAGWIVLEAWHRLNEPVEILGGLMLGVALAGCAVNVLAFWILRGGDQNNLNMRAAVLHVTGDLLGSVAAILAAVIIISTGWSPIDPLLSLVVALIILRSAWVIVRQSGHILLEGSPAGVDTHLVKTDLESAFPWIAEVHHVHAWSITQERPMVTLHARVHDGGPPEAASTAIKTHLRKRFGVAHATIEIEHEICADSHNES